MGVSVGVEVGVGVELGTSVGSEPWVPVGLVMGPRAGPVVRGGPAGGVVPFVAFLAGSLSVVRVLAAGVTGQVDGVLVAASALCPPPGSSSALPSAVGELFGVAGSVLGGSVTSGGSVAFGSPAVRLVTPSTRARAAVVAPAIATRIRNSRRRPRRTSSSVGTSGTLTPRASACSFSSRNRSAGSVIAVLLGWLVSVRSAVRSLSRAAEVWLFTVPGLTPRSAAVSSTESPQ